LLSAGVDWLIVAPVDGEVLVCDREFGFEEPLVDYAEVTDTNVPEADGALLSVPVPVDEELGEHRAEIVVRELDVG
jgi:hypothetical protein